MTFFIERNGKKNIPRSIYIKVLVFVGLIGLSTVAFKPVQAVIGEAAANIRTNFIGRLETYTGMEIRYSSVRPAFLTSFDVKNLKFLKDGDEVLTVSRVRITYSLRELLLGRKAVINFIQIERPVIRLDMDKDRDLFEHFKSLSNKSISKPSDDDTEILSQIAEFLPKNADYRIRSGSFSVSSGQALFQINNVNVNLRGNGGDILFDTKFNADVFYSGLFNRTLIAGAGMGANGVYLSDLNECKAEIAFSSLALSQRNVKKRQGMFFLPASAESGVPATLFNMRPVTVGFSYKNGNITLTPVLENAKSSYYFRYDTKTRALIAEVKPNGFIPSSVISLPDNLRLKNVNFFNMETTGNLLFKYENGFLDYSINLESGNLTRPWQNNANISEAYLIRAHGNKERITVSDLCLNMPPAAASAGLFQGIVDFSGSVGFAPLRPSGIFSVDRFSLTGKDYANGVFNLSTRGQDVHITGGRFSLGSAKFKNLDMRFLPSQRDMAVSVLSSCEDGGAVNVYAVLNRNPQHLEVSVAFDSFSVFNLTESFRPFANLANNPPSSDVYTRGAFLSTEIFFSSDYTNIVYNVPSVTLERGAYKSGAFISDGTIGLFSLSGTNNQLNLSEGIIYIGENELTLFAAANFLDPMNIDFNVNANYLDVSWNIIGSFLDRTTFIIRDPNGLNAFGGVSNAGVVSGYIEGVNFPVPARDNPVYTDFYVTMRYNSANFWSLNVSHFKLKNLLSHNGEVALSFSGDADQDGANFKDISYSDNKGSLLGSADFFWDTDFSNPRFIISMTDGEDFEESDDFGEFYKLEGMTSNGSFNINASVSNMRVDRFVKGSGQILASADAKVAWNSIDSFNAQINLSSFYARLRTNSIQASVDMTLSNDGITANDFKLDYSGLRTVFPVFSLSSAKGSAKIEAELDGFAGKRKLEGKVSLDANFNPINSWTDIRKAFNTFNATLQAENIQFGDLSQDSIVFLFSADENAISISGGINDMLMVQADREGNFYASLADPLPIRGSFSGVIQENGHFDAYCNDYFIDLASLWNLTSNSKDNFNISGGYITGKMNLSGPVWNPEFSGTGRATSLSLQVPNYISEDIKPVPFDILAEGYEVIFGPVAAASGSGGGYVDGWFRFEYWIPRNIGLDISIPRENPIPYKTGVAGLVADGIASGKLNLEANLNDRVIEIAGDLFVNDTGMSIDVGKITATMEDSDSDNRLASLVEITITTGPTLEFLWPNTNTPILRINPETGTVFKVSYDSQAAQYSVVGDIKIRSGEIYYLDRFFYIRQGNLIFRENERQFNPILNVRAETRDRSNSGPVTISMVVENQPLLSFVPRFESTPSLTQLELYSILSQNPNIQGENTDMTQRFLLTSSTELMSNIFAGSEIFSYMGFMRQFERRARNLLHLDMLSVRTKFFQNAVATSGYSMLGANGSNVDRMFRVGNYFDNTTVFIGKYIGQDMFVYGTLAMKYDENSTRFGGIKIEPDIGLEMQSPYFSIRWSFYPYHPENWWVDDHSITLLWSKKY
ncbi:MAG: translocation/assembly module TamB [Treponema sp.]|nr:translocation/assembly module TamB [Treponema sp.]